MPPSIAESLQKKRRQPIANRAAATQDNHSRHATTLSSVTIQRAQQNPHSLASHEVMSLQRSMGNRAVNNLMRGASNGVPSLQAKLQVGPAHDKYEDEADQMASHVISRKASSQTVGDQGGPAPTNIEQGIRSARGGGSSLPEGIRRSMEGSLGADFSGVRVHTDARADTLNRSLSARAFTTGQDLFFKKGEYSPDSGAGRSLLAHELTHVVQQTGGSGGGQGSHAQRSPLIQRFGDQDVERGAHTDWAGQTTRVSKKSEGMVSAVFMMYANNGEPLVVKTEGQDNEENQRPTFASQFQFGDAVLRELGFQVPGSRIVRSGDPEFQEIVNVITARIERPQAPEEQRALDQALQKLPEARYFKVMSLAKGRSFQAILKEVETKEQADHFFARLSANDFAMMRNIGKMMSADAVMGNEDRLNVSPNNYQKFNAGNLFFSDDGQMSLIDNEVTLGRQDKIGLEEGGAFHTQGNELMNPLFDGLDRYLEKLFHEEMARRMHRGNEGANGGFNLKEYIATWMTNNREAIEKAFKEGVQAGVRDTTSLFLNKDKMQGLKNEAHSHGDESAGRMWGSFKARGRFIMARSGGMSKEDAMNESTLYQRYKYNKGNDIQQPEALNEEMATFDAPKLRKRKGAMKLFGSSTAWARKAKQKSRSLLEQDDVLNRIKRTVHGPNPLTQSAFVGPINPLMEELSGRRKTAKGSRYSSKEIDFLKKSLRLAMFVQIKDSEIYHMGQDVDKLSGYLSRYGNLQSKEKQMAVARVQQYSNPAHVNALRGQVNALVRNVQNAEAFLKDNSPKFGAKLLEFADSMQMSMQSLLDKLRNSPHANFQDNGQIGQNGPQLGAPNE